MLDIIMAAALTTVLVGACALLFVACIALFYREQRDLHGDVDFMKRRRREHVQRRLRRERRAMMEKKW